MYLANADIRAYRYLKQLKYGLQEYLINLSPIVNLPDKTHERHQTYTYTS